MSSLAATRCLAVLQDYAAGRLATREAIERAGLDDDADLLVAMAIYGRAMLKPTGPAEGAAQIALATELLQPTYLMTLVNQ